ncbi:MAG: hypothetical protein KatS3mg050_0531 [Litorilinea sp.]|nr:MAG: hypothetical protein KatS3mg050_0531 [Litorilinea sp.]
MTYIEQDMQRFRAIVRGKIKENLRKYVSNHELIGRQGRDLVSIPVPQLDLPRFTFGKVGSGGVGQGSGEPGDPLGPPQPGDGAGEAGDQPGQHILEVELSLDELVQILAEELELPRIQPKGNQNVESEIARYTDIRRVGPESLRHFKRTYREALKRQLASGTYDPKNPVIIPIRDDRRYRSFVRKPTPEANAVIVYMMDVSGSMGEREKRLVRTTAFWIDAWLKTNYHRVTRRYIVHDATAAEVDEETFYRLRQSGGTKISSALELCHRLLLAHYPVADWNIYLFQFSDGENFEQDNRVALDLLREQLLPMANLYCYGQVNDLHYRDTFIDALNRLDAPDNLVSTRIPDEEAIYQALKVFLGKGR